MTYLLEIKNIFDLNIRESINCNIKFLNSKFFPSFFDPWSLIQKLDFTRQSSNIVCVFTWCFETKFSETLRSNWFLSAFFIWMSNINIFLQRKFSSTCVFNDGPLVSSWSILYCRYLNILVRSNLQISIVFCQSIKTNINLSWNLTVV